MPFTRPIIAAGDGSLVIDQMKSPNYDGISHGWAVFKNGAATFFNAITGNNFVLGPMNLGATPYLNLMKYFANLGETSVPAWKQISALYTTTSAFADPGFGNLSLPLNANFNGGSTSNIYVYAFINADSNGTVPSGQFDLQVLKDGSAMANGSGMSWNPGAANVRMPLVGVWTDTCVYVAGAPQSTFTVQAKDSAGPNHYSIHSNSFVMVAETPVLSTFLQS